jgi:lipopolysaccharide cholinephosphotransferase
MSGEHMNKQVALNNLLIIRDLFAARGIPMFLTFGTLLGAIREKDFIAHDDDVDVGVFSRSRDAILTLIPELENRGFRMRSVRDERVYKLERQAIKLDLFCAVPKKTFRGRRWDLDGKTTIAARYLDGLEEIEFLGHRFPVPQDPRGVIRSLYGRTWNVPIPDSTSRQDWSRRIKMIFRNPAKVFFYARRFLAGRRRARTLRRESTRKASS